jgi:hypothetical protein
MIDRKQSAMIARMSVNERCAGRPGASAQRARRTVGAGGRNRDSSSAAVAASSRHF